MNTESVYKKRKSGQKLRSKEKQIVFNVFKHFNKDKTVSDAVKQTSIATGCSERTVYSIRQEASRGPLKTPSKTKPCRIPNRNSRTEIYDDFVKSAIRRKVHNFFINNIPPTINSILCSVNKHSTGF